MAVIGDLVVNLSTDSRKFSSGLEQAKGGLDKFQGLMAGATAAVVNFGLQMSVSAAAGVASLGTQILALAADAETARIQFEVLTGDAATGVKLFKDIEKFAARTSFDLTSAAGATKSLLAAGVGEGDVISTMQLLGDLAMGDANKLGFLSKAYTDVMNKGKLQGQELRQFAENGVGLAAALSKTMGISTAEVLKLSEDGKISFNDMQEALLGLTGEGGRFNGMMERINQTMTGQWNSLLEQIQTIGRDLGALILPTLTQIVSETNKFLQAFMQVEDKGKFIGELLEAGIDVGFESIFANWEMLLGRMIVEATKAAGKLSDILNPAQGVGKLVGKNVGRKIDGAMDPNAPSRLDQSKARLAGVMAQLQAVAPKPEAIPQLQAVAPKPEAIPQLQGNVTQKMIDDANNNLNRVMQESTDSQLKAGVAREDLKATDAEREAYAKVRSLQETFDKQKQGSKVAGLFGDAKGFGASLFDTAKNKVGEALGKAKVQLDFVKDVGGKAIGIGGDKIKEEKIKSATSVKEETQTAGAMQKGSAEAYSAIVKNMLRTSDPVVKATKDSAKMIVKAVKDSKPPQPKFLPEFA